MCIRKGAKDSFDNLTFGSIFNLFTNYINLSVFQSLPLHLTGNIVCFHCIKHFKLYNYAVYLFTLRIFCIIVPLHIFHILYSKDIVSVVYLLMFVDYVALMCLC